MAEVFRHVCKESRRVFLLIRHMTEILISAGRYLLLTAMAGDLLVSLFLSLFYKGYSSLKMSISALGNPSSPVRLNLVFMYLPLALAAVRFL